MSEIELKQVGKRYGDVTVLSDISLEMADGEFVVLVGPSGCGKSTLLRMIAGLEDITSGQITIGGKVVNNMPAKERDIAMVFQSYALYPHMKVADNMSFSLRLAGTSKAEIRQRERMAELRRTRDDEAVDASLAKLQEAARAGENVIPAMMDAVRAYATLYEIRFALEEVFGAYQEPVFF